MLTPKRIINWLLISLSMVGNGLFSEEDAPPKNTFVIDYTQAVYDFSGKQQKLILEGPITMTNQTTIIKCDHAEVLSSRTNSDDGNPIESKTSLGTIDYILAVGHVDIQQMGTQALAGKAEIFPLERKLVLEDNPRIIDANGTVSGYRITFLQGDRQIKIDPDPSETGKRNRIQLNDISEIEFLMGDNPPTQTDPNPSDQ